MKTSSLLISDWKEFVQKKKDRLIKKAKAKKRMLKYMRKLDDEYLYAIWIKGYMEKGGEAFDHGGNLRDTEMYIATKNFTMIPLYETDAVSIIVPEDVHVYNSEDCGHNDLYYFKDYTTNNITVSYDTLTDQCLNELDDNIILTKELIGDLKRKTSIKNLFNIFKWFS